MAKELLPEELWKQIRPLLPAHPPQPKGGTLWKSDRDCLRGILFVLRTGIPWSLLPVEAFGVSGVTCWRRLRDWTSSGVWPRLHARLVGVLEELGAVDHSIGLIDSASVRAVFGGRIRGRIRLIEPSVDASGI
jgi:transposase